MENRAGIRIWDSVRSDVAGCEAWVNPQPLVFQGDLLRADCPALALVDRLRELDYVGRDLKQLHSKRSGLYYDTRNVSKRTPYLQCLLARDQLFAKGAPNFTSVESNAFFKLLLRSPSDVRSKMTALQCKSKLLQLGDSLPLAAEAPKRLPLRDVDGDSGDDDVTATRPKKCVRVAAPLADIGAPEVSGDDIPLEGIARSSSSSSDSNSASGVSGDGDTAPDFSQFPAFIGGVRVRREQHATKKDWGLRVTCPVHGGKCKRFRSLGLDVEVYGVTAPIHYLSTWLAGGRGMDANAHRKRYPSRKAIRNHLELSGESKKRAGDPKQTCISMFENE